MYRPYRLRQNAGDGAYDILHVETNTGMVLRFNENGTLRGTLEASLISIENTIGDINRSISGLNSSVSGKIDKIAEPGGGGLVQTDENGVLSNAGKNVSDFALSGHTHALTDSTITGTLGVGKGGTGVTTLQALRNALGLGDTTGALPIANGGTGSSNAEAARTALGITLANLGVTVEAAKINMLSGATSNIQEQLNAITSGYVANSKVGVANGVAGLDENGHVPSSQLPGYVDDVIDGRLVNTTTFKDLDNKTISPEAGKIYNDVDTNKSYRWSGSAYVAMNEGIALGNTSATAYRGDYGEVAYNHSQTTHAPSNATHVEYVSNGVLKIGSSDTTIYSHPSYNGTKQTASATVGNGSTFQAITEISITNGHINSYKVTTFTIPTSVSMLTQATQPGASAQSAGDLWLENISIS